MFTQPTKKRVNCFVAAAIVLTLAGVFVASLAFARLVNNTIDPVAIVAGGGAPSHRDWANQLHGGREGVSARDGDPA
jgi:hypothetical protein